MNDEQRQKVIELVRAGHEPSSAAAMAGTSLDQLDEATAREVYAAFKAVSARLKAKLMERALSGDGDAKLLASLLEQRERALETAEPKFDASDPQQVRQLCRGILAAVSGLPEPEADALLRALRMIPAPHVEPVPIPRARFELTAPLIADDDAEGDQ